MKDPILCNSRGTAMLALLALKRFQLEDLGALVEVERIFEPRAELKPLYDERFKTLVGLYQKNKSFFIKMNEAKS